MIYRFTPGRLAVLALAIITAPVLAQKAERPDVKVGDQWHFASGYVAPSTPDRIWVVTAVTASGIEGTENGQPLKLTRDMNAVDSPRRTDSDRRGLSFPLEVGKPW